MLVHLGCLGLFSWRGCANSVSWICRIRCKDWRSGTSTCSRAWSPRSGSAFLQKRRCGGRIGWGRRAGAGWSRRPPATAERAGRSWIEIPSGTARLQLPLPALRSPTLKSGKSPLSSLRSWTITRLVINTNPDATLELYGWLIYLVWPLFQALLHTSVAMERKLVVEWVPLYDLGRWPVLLTMDFRPFLFSSVNLPLMLWRCLLCVDDLWSPLESMATAKG